MGASLRLRSLFWPVWLEAARCERARKAGGKVYSCIREKPILEKMKDEGEVCLPRNPGCCIGSNLTRVAALAYSPRRMVLGIKRRATHVKFARSEHMRSRKANVGSGLR